MTTDSNIWRRSCAGACHQGRHPCSTPQACQLPDDDDRPIPGGGVIVWLLAAVLVGAIAAFVVLVTR